jgi:hypothetical protein
MSDERLTQDVNDAVEKIFAKKEEEDMRKETEAALNNAAEKIEELVSDLEAKGKEVDESNQTIADLEVKASDLEKEKSDLEAEKAELADRAEKAETELENIKKDQLAQSRFADLKEAGIAATNEQAVEDQIAKIREMADEDFETYVTELTAVREAIVAELQASEDPVDTEEEAAEEESEEEAAEEESEEEAAEEESEEEAAEEESEEEAAEEESEEEAAEEDSEEEAAEEVEAEVEEEEAAADSEESIDPMRAVAAALNMEHAPSKGMLTKYKALGTQLAEDLNKK